MSTVVIYSLILLNKTKKKMFTINKNNKQIVYKFIIYYVGSLSSSYGYAYLVKEKKGEIKRERERERDEERWREMERKILTHRN